MSELTSVLGIDPNTAGDAYRQQAQQYLSQIAASATGYGQIAGQQGGLYVGDNSTYRGALGTEEDALGQGFTNADRQGYIAGQTAPVGTSYQAGQSNLLAQMSANGLGISGSRVGGLADLDAARAGSYAAAAGGANNYFTNAQLQRDTQLTGLTSGAASQDYQREMGAMGAQTNLDQGIASAYGNIANQAYAQKQQQQQGIFANIGQLASGAASLYGMGTGSLGYGTGGGGGGTGTPSPYNSDNLYASGGGYGMTAGGMPSYAGYGYDPYGILQ